MVCAHCFSGTKVKWWLANKKMTSFFRSSLYCCLPFGFTHAYLKILKFQDSVYLKLKQCVRIIKGVSKFLSVWCSTCIILLTMKSVVQTNRPFIALMSLCLDPLLVRYFLIISYCKALIKRPLSNKCPPSIFRNGRLFEFDKYELVESIRD